MNHEERQIIESRLRNLLELHIYSDVANMLRDYSGALKTKDGKNAMIILDLTNSEQQAFYQAYNDYLKEGTI